ncbi:hypothetical protein GH714_026650 [Hevea brasiliensis]|uniref:Uncharacterized protein n=1 Tax=Hevea brasiliensis TaxID=3981 RepID=A0A6A6LWL6_HEVBR|nr:hypothetical protein GH714_026650 [Hevea brasiliensis]
MLIFQPCSSSLYPSAHSALKFPCIFSFPKFQRCIPKQNHYARTGISFFGAKLIVLREGAIKGRFSGREEEKNYDKDPEFAEILGSCLDDPQKAQLMELLDIQMEERLRGEKKQGFAHKDGSAIPEGNTGMAHNGRLGGCNSMNMQGANVTPTTFYNIGDFEIQDKLGTYMVLIKLLQGVYWNTRAIGLDVLINALTQISSETIAFELAIHW